MNFELKFSDLSVAGPVKMEFDPEFDNIVSILNGTCDALEGTGTFVIEGFGRGIWPTDLYSDLCIFLEHLPVALIAIESKKDFVIEFYEQGLELRLEFFVEGDRYIARCAPMHGVLENSVRPTETIDTKTIHQMFRGVMDEFLRVVRQLYPWLLDNPCVRGWLKGEPVW
ncbi:MAG TPA: hypothetical protein VM555_08250 [Tahibacter sp.]|jgi:hypothetical protein|nr:hypothetical protein [Tahibacter sp.]